MSEYNKITHGTFVSTGIGKFLQMDYMPNSFEMTNLTVYETSAINLVSKAFSWVDRAVGSASVEVFNEISSISTGGIYFIKSGTYRYGPSITIASITQAAEALVTTGSAHNLSTGSSVLLNKTTGMRQISSETYAVTVVSPTSFTIPVNSSGFAAPASAGVMKELLYPDLYIPFRSAITAIQLGATTIIDTSLNHAFVEGQEVYMQIPIVSEAAWGTVELDTQKYMVANSSPQLAYVVSIPSPNQVEINIDSSGFTPFAYPTSVEAGLGMSFPSIYGIGDYNYGPIGPPPFEQPITVPGAFVVNTRTGVTIGTGDGTTIMHSAGDIIKWNAIFPDVVKT